MRLFLCALSRLRVSLSYIYLTLALSLCVYALRFMGLTHLIQSIKLKCSEGFSVVLIWLKWGVNSLNSNGCSSPFQVERISLPALAKCPLIRSCHTPKSESRHLRVVSARWREDGRYWFFGISEGDCVKNEPIFRAPRSSASPIRSNSQPDPESRTRSRHLAR